MKFLQLILVLFAAFFVLFFTIPKKDDASVYKNMYFIRGIGGFILLLILAWMILTNKYKLW